MQHQHRISFSVHFNPVGLHSPPRSISPAYSSTNTPHSLESSTPTLAAETYTSHWGQNVPSASRWFVRTDTVAAHNTGKVRDEASAGECSWNSLSYIPRWSNTHMSNPRPMGQKRPLMESSLVHMKLSNYYQSSVVVTAEMAHVSLPV